MDISLLRSSFERVRPSADEAAQAFYTYMLGTFPQVRPLFENTDFDEQRKKLMASLSMIVELVDRPEQLGKMLDTMGRSHQGYGVTAPMYLFVSASLLHTLAGFFGDDWTPELADTWATALQVVSAQMIEAQERGAA
jgi:hemoglobin-like flavoprotein